MDLYPIYAVSEIDVQAFEMTNTTFKYRCKCKKGFHVHGNGGDLSDRVEYRSCHCQAFEGPVRIVIDEDTLRKIKSNSKIKHD